MSTPTHSFFVSVLFAVALPVTAQLEVGGSVLDNCSQIDALRKAGDFTAARDKAAICLEALEQEITGSVGKRFPADVAGWKRTNIEQNNVLGFTNVTATYAKGDTTATVAFRLASPSMGHSRTARSLRSPRRASTRRRAPSPASAIS